MSESPKKHISDLFIQEGFNQIGFLNKKDCDFGNWIENWLDNEFQGEMKWMTQYPEIRRNPCLIESYGNTIISAAINYKTRAPEIWGTKNPISNYAWGEDYHVVLRRKAQNVLKQIENLFSGFKGRIFVDTAPIPEKIVAMQCGIGWIGKNGVLINRKLGSYLFLIEIVTNLDLSSDSPAKDYCGTCRKCIEACPTNAILENKVVDANRCISYLTIEKRGEFSDTEKRMIDYQVFGCDICQQACPWNKKGPYSGLMEFSCADKWLQVDFTNPSKMTVEYFNELKIKSPVKRTKFDGFIRNIKAVIDKP